MGELISKHKLHWSNQDFYQSTMWGVLLFAVGLIINAMANNYVVLVGNNPVTDIVLSNVPVFDVDVIVNYAPIFLVAIIASICIIRPSAIPFTIKAIATFIIIRAFFISLTHLGQFQPQIVLPTSKFIRFFGGGNTGGLFFSGHTGIPFLAALIFWDNKWLRYFFIVGAIFLGTVMLLGHLHYTIDVASAFFITPTIFYIAQQLFNKDYKFLSEGIEDIS